MLKPAVALVVLLLASPANAVIAHKGDTIAGALQGRNQPIFWDSNQTWRYWPVWLDQGKTRALKGAACISNEFGRGANGLWFDRDGDCIRVSLPAKPEKPPKSGKPDKPKPNKPAKPVVVIPPDPPIVVIPPIVIPPDSPNVIPLPASLPLFLAALVGLVGLRRRRT